ncbi:hypothetical protein HFO38_17465 [Rhizobium leguminosarum]|uniref:hypothetical protein n=1 Tax=Rhizobium leguminosarum TaxID=384 RepID=UPI001C94DC94|nr:hypothetical protein [Rhizobium leguminosarum]MBY5704488.1 hypothetical protein [Rhizobium leguminosarum]
MTIADSINRNMPLAGQADDEQAAKKAAEEAYSRGKTCVIVRPPASDSIVLTKCSSGRTSAVAASTPEPSLLIGSVKNFDPACRHRHDSGTNLSSCRSPTSEGIRQ